MTRYDFSEHYGGRMIESDDGEFVRYDDLSTPPDVDAAFIMGQNGSDYSEGERLAFEAWVRGHCWELSAKWVGNGYLGDTEDFNHVCPHATRTRQLWAAWRDRAALSR